MIRTFLSFALLAGGLTLPVAALAADPAASGATDAASDSADEKTTADLEMARAYFQNGVELVTSDPPNYQDAYSQFQQALKASGGNWKVLSNLGYCAMKLERDQEAISYYERYIAEGGAEIDSEELADLKKELLLMKGNMGSFHVTSDTADFKLLVKREGSAAPSQSYEFSGTEGTLGLRAGTYLLNATSEKKRIQVQVVLRPGKTTDYELEFQDPAKADQSSTAVSPPRDAEPPKEKHAIRTSGYILGSVGLATLGWGVASFAISKNQANKATSVLQDDCATVAGQVQCTSDQVETIDNANNKSRTFQTLSYVSYGVGGALVATGITFIVMDSMKRENPTKDQALRVIPTVSPTFAGAEARIRF